MPPAPPKPNGSKGSTWRQAAVPKGQLISWRFSSAPQKQVKERQPLTRSDYRSNQKRDSERFSQEQSHDHRIDPALIAQESGQLIPPRQIYVPVNEVEITLDPFCILPTDLTGEDRQLLQFYVTTVPGDIYGTRSDAVFNPVREVSFALSLKYSLTLQWVVIAAEAFVAGRRGKGLPPSLFRRKFQAYKALHQSLLENQEEEIPDALISGMIMATITESRISKPGISNLHLNGYERTIRARGGLKKIIMASSSSLLQTSHLMPYLVCEPSVTDLVFGKNSTEQVMHILQIIARGENVTDPADLFFTVSPDFRSSDHSSQSLELTLAEPLRLLLTSRTLTPYLRPDIWTYSRYARKTGHFISLFIIASTLWKLRRNMTSSQLFLGRLKLVLNKSSAYDNTGRSLLTMEGLMWVVVKAAFDVYDTLDGKEVRVENQANIIVDAVSALKLFRVVDDTIRQKMIYFLCDCLSDGREFTMVILDGPG